MEDTKRLLPPGRMKQVGVDGGAMGVGSGGFHLEPSSEEGNCKKLNIWVWLGSSLGGGCGGRGER